MLTMLRDDLEDQNLDKELAKRANSFLNLVNKRLDNMHSNNKEANEALILITQLIEDIFKQIKL